ALGPVAAARATGTETPGAALARRAAVKKGAGFVQSSSVPAGGSLPSPGTGLPAPTGSPASSADPACAAAAGAPGGASSPGAARATPLPVPRWWQTRPWVRYLQELLLVHGRQRYTLSLSEQHAVLAATIPEERRVEVNPLALPPPLHALWRRVRHAPDTLL